MRLVALVRPVPASYADATRAEATPIDVGLARRQHGAYLAALERCGAVVHTLPPADDLPDSVFVEDCAVIVGDRALIPRSAHPVRAAERASVATALGALGLAVEHLAAGHCDGGDVMLAGGRLFVGLSTRTDRAGARALAAAGLPVVPVPLPPGVLHLKCVVSPLADDEILLAEQTLDPGIFAGLRPHRVPAEEAWGANVVAIGRQVVAGAGCPRTADVLDKAGYTPILVEASEIRAADGAMTCLSLRWTNATIGPTDHPRPERRW